jgi:hypothetical protein
MYCVQWIYPKTATMTREKADQLFNDVAGNYLGVPGLIRKYFGYADDGQTVMGIYLWRSKADADAFYTAEWIAAVTARWGGAPLRHDWQVPVVTETAAGKVVTDQDLLAAAE